MPKTVEVNLLSKETIQVPIPAPKVNGAYVVLSGLAVVMAFPVAGVAPVSGDWKAATWDTDTATTPPTYKAQCEVGGTGTGATVVLAEGKYGVYVKVTDTPDIPVKRAGYVQVVSP